MADSMTSRMGSVFVQFTPGKQPLYVGCIDMDALTMPQGDVGMITCRDDHGNFVSVGHTEGVPGAPTTSITALVPPDSDVLDTIARCPINLIITQASCGRLGVLTNYDRYYLLGKARMTAKTIDMLVKRETDEASTRKMDFTGQYPVHDGRRLNIGRVATTEIENLSNISFCNDVRCSGDCGDAVDVCTEGFIGPEAGAAASANVLNTLDGGNTWTAAVADPWGVGLNVIGTTCFQIDRNTTRRLVGRETVPATPMSISYTDDNGATAWHPVVVGAAVAEFPGPHGIFSLDKDHIWIATSRGAVYFSSDSGVTWAEQATAVLATAGSALKSIRFSDADNGFAVGAAGAVISTNDGGYTWSATPTDPSGGDDFLCVHVFDKYRLIAGTDEGELYQSWDGGLTWDQNNTFTGANAGDVMDVMFANELEGFMLHNTVAPIGWVHKTIDGGYTWERLTTPANLGLNELYVCSGNLAFAVGNKDAGPLGVILKISG